MFPVMRFVITFVVWFYFILLTDCLHVKFSLKLLLQTLNFTLYSTWKNIYNYLVYTRYTEFLASCKIIFIFFYHNNTPFLLQWDEIFHSLYTFQL